METERERTVTWGERPVSMLRQLLTVQGLVLTAVLLIIAYLTIVPMVALLLRTFATDGALTLAPFEEVFGTTGIGKIALNTIAFSASSTFLAAIVGTGLAYVYVRTDVPFKRLIFALSLIPLILPSLLHTISWILLLSPRIGWFNHFLEPLFGPGALNVFTVGGMAFVQGLHLSPLVFLLMSAAFRSMDPSLEEAALLSGARRSTVFVRITLPLARPALLAAILVQMVNSLEAFEVPVLMGLPGGIFVFTSRIWQLLSSRFPPAFGEAGAFAITLLVFTTAGVFLSGRLLRRGRSFQTITGKGSRFRVIELGKWRYVAGVCVGLYFMIAVVFPLFVLIYASTQPFYARPSFESLRTMSLDNYRDVLSDGATLRAFKNSLALGLGSATAIMLVTAVAAWITVRTRIVGRTLVDALATFPLAVPGLVMGVALIFVYLRLPVGIYGTLWILGIAYFTRFMPYGMRSASSAMHQIGQELEEAAHTSGADWWQTFRRVLVPLLMPGLFAGWFYVFAASARELSSSILLYSPGNEVLAIRVFELYINGKFTETAALGMVMVLVLGVLVILIRKAGERLGSGQVT